MCHHHSNIYNGVLVILRRNRHVYTLVILFKSPLKQIVLKGKSGDIPFFFLVIFENFNEKSKPKINVSFY